jgi:hypothetical protein
MWVHSAEFNCQKVFPHDVSEICIVRKQKRGVTLYICQFNPPCMICRRGIIYSVPVVVGPEINVV